jgi:hypothetical protein
VERFFVTPARARTPAAPGCVTGQPVCHAMHEFAVIATFAVICAVYLGLFLAAEKFFMKDE